MRGLDEEVGSCVLDRSVPPCALEEEERQSEGRKEGKRRSEMPLTTTIGRMIIKTRTYSPNTCRENERER